MYDRTMSIPRSLFVQKNKSDSRLSFLSKKKTNLLSFLRKDTDVYIDKKKIGYYDNIGDYYTCNVIVKKLSKKNSVLMLQNHLFFHDYLKKFNNYVKEIGLQLPIFSLYMDKSYIYFRWSYINSSFEKSNIANEIIDVKNTLDNQMLMLNNNSEFNLDAVNPSLKDKVVYLL